jgi:AraC family transcriptional regulator of adaptative response / DNA-3-methyladenine glycosylase II
MKLNVDICERARLSRDPRFDGRFFIGVTTTGVYCRPICPAQPPKRENVRFFPSAAAAAEAGFRPCLRCRPEASPGTPAWLGTSTTVSRALKLIGESALDNGGVNQLSERLGIGSRHLRRLFVQHLGAPPAAVAQTRRLHFAKKLIDETNLPLAQVAFTSGFGSIRRFNAAFQQIYRRTPKELRLLARAERRRTPPNCYLFKLPYRPPYDWNSLVGFLAARAIPGVEAVDENSYRRTITVEGACGTIEVRHLPRRHLLRTAHRNSRSPPPVLDH